MTETEHINAFKAAFRIKAATDNAKIRWTAPTKKWQSQTSMKGVADALDRLAGAPSQDNVDRVRQVIAGLPAKKQTKYKATLDQLKRELDQVVVESEEVIDGINQIKTANGKIGFHDEDRTPLIADVSEDKAKYMAQVLAELDTALDGTGVALDGIKKLLESIQMDDKLSGDMAGTVWEEAIRHLKDTVLPAVNDDLGVMKASGLIPDGATLKGVAFTGSDFHKGGKQVLILRFEDSDGDEKKVVYKPSSLQVDKLLFGADSVADKLGGISTYNIVPINEDDGSDAGYGYMEFIDSGGGPTKAADVLKIYESLAAAMAMSYYVGLDDVHQENLIVKKDALQVIDMEATTGIFKVGRSESSNGFNDQLWGKGIYQGIGATLNKLIQERTLTSLPEDDVVEQAMVDKFGEVLGRMTGDELETDLGGLEKALAEQYTRIVPIATNDFQKTLIPEAQKYATLTDWKHKLGLDLTGMTDVDPEDYGKHGSNLLVVGKGQTSSSLDVVKRLLEAPGVYKAMKRGDVPYYRRELGSTDVFDEEDNAIDASGHPKVGEPIDVAMKKRREADSHENIVKIFRTQAMNHVRRVQDEARQRLPR